jgi:hypothetical protein
MEEWPVEPCGHDYQLQSDMSPSAFQFDFSDPKRSHRKLSPTAVIDISPKNAIYEEHGWPSEETTNLRLDRNGDFDNKLDSVNTSNLENGKVLHSVIANRKPSQRSNKLHDRPPRPLEDGSLVQQNLTESQPSMNLVNPKRHFLSRRPSNSEGLVMQNSPSSSESLPPPRPPPGPGPGPGAKLSIQIESGEASKDGHPQPPPAQFFEPDEASPTGRLFSVRSAQSLQPRSRSRQTQRKESRGDILERIKVLRADIWGLRSNISEKRSVLREKELGKSIADDKFMKFIRTTGLGKLSRRDKMKEQDTLRKLFEDCEALRNEYGPLEDDCNILENDLNNREYQMQKMEAALNERWNEIPHSERESASPQHSSPPSNYSGSEFSQAFHPLVTQYLSKVGDVEIFRERLEWHSDEQLTLEEEKETRERVNRKLAEADQQWLDNYAEAESALRRQLRKAEIEAEKLRMECYSRNLVDEDGEPLDFEDQERRTFVADEVDPGSEISDFVKFPRLLTNPGSKEDLLPDPLPPPDDTKGEEVYEKTQDPSDRINSWLLQTLRSSPLDVNLLVRTFESVVGHILEGEKWQIEVLTFWYDDGSKEMAAKYSRSLSEVVTHSRHKMGEQQASLSGRHSMGILVRSSRLSPPKIGDERAIKANGLSVPSSTVVKRDEGKGI